MRLDRIPFSVASGERGLRILAFNLEDTAADVQIPLRVWNFNPGGPQMFFNEEIEIASETPRTAAHFSAPNDQLKVDGAAAEFIEENSRRRIGERGFVFPTRSDESFLHFVDVPPVSHADRNAEPNARVAIGPVRDRR